MRLVNIHLVPFLFLFLVVSAFHSAQSQEESTAKSTDVELGRLQGHWMRSDDRGLNVSTDFFPPDAEYGTGVQALAKAFLSSKAIEIDGNSIVFTQSKEARYRFVIGSIRGGHRDSVKNVICLQGEAEIQIGTYWFDDEGLLHLSFHNGLTDVRKDKADDSFSQVTVKVRRETNMRLGWTVTFSRTQRDK